MVGGATMPPKPASVAAPRKGRRVLVPHGLDPVADHGQVHGVGGDLGGTAAPADECGELFGVVGAHRAFIAGLAACRARHGHDLALDLVHAAPEGVDLGLAGQRLELAAQQRARRPRAKVATRTDDAEQQPVDLDGALGPEHLDGGGLGRRHLIGGHRCGHPPVEQPHGAQFSLCARQVELHPRLVEHHGATVTRRGGRPVEHLVEDLAGDPRPGGEPHPLVVERRVIMRHPSFSAPIRLSSGTRTSS